MKKLLFILLVSFGCSFSLLAQKSPSKSKIAPKSTMDTQKAMEAKIAKLKLAEQKRKDVEQKQHASSNEAAMSNAVLNTTKSPAKK